MPFDVNFAIDSMYPAANAAYLIMNVPPPPLLLPQGYDLVGTIKADPTAAAPALAQATPDQQRIANLAVSESSIFGLLGWNPTTKSAIVAIRGTKTLWEWIADADAVPVPWIRYPQDGLVHMGFALLYEHIGTSIRTLLDPYAAQANEIWVTGHSLGGALAVLAGYDIAKSLTVAPKLYTFAEPRTFDPRFAANFNTIIPQCERIVNFMDVVPQVPLPPAYEHVGAETLVYGGFRPLDITYAHHLTTYLNGLQKLKGIVPTQTPAVPQAVAQPTPTPTPVQLAGR